MLASIAHMSLRRPLPILRSSSRLLSNSAGYAFMAGEAQETTNRGLVFSTGIMGHLSEASVLCKQGGTVVHAVVNSAWESDAQHAFLPLTVDYRSRNYSIGVVPSLPSRRERHGTDDEILVSRCIDRVVRPLFPKGYVNEVQILATSHAADGIHDPTIAAVNAASFALTLSKQPWYGPVGCVRVGLVDGELCVDPTLEDMKRSTLDFVYAGTADRALMVEAIGEQIPEETIQNAMAMANKAVCEIIATQLKLLKRIEDKAQENNIKTEEGAEQHDVALAHKKEYFTIPEAMKSTVFELGYDRAVALYSNGVLDKTTRGRNEGKLRSELAAEVSAHAEWGQCSPLIQGMAVDSVMHSAFRSTLLRNVTEGGDEIPVRRADGRELNEVRKITSAVEVLPVVHGSSYFARGDTHVLSTVTLGMYDKARRVLPIDGSGREEKIQTFMLHYDFPPYSTGEMGQSNAPNRRMVGHGNLAEKALRPVMPSFQDFPYVVRVYCECTGSNGSSSMASACAGSLALLDAGVPLKAPVAGVSVGLVTDPSVALRFDGEYPHTATSSGKEFVVLKDLTGSEDYNGDMDYKIAGTARGITAIQLDVKLPGGVPLRMLNAALSVAKEGRLQILQKMNETKATSNLTVKTEAPKAEMVRYDEDRKPLLIGPRGDMLRFMRELYDVTVDVDTHDGAAYIYGYDAQKVAACSQLIQDIAVLVKVGDTVTATVTKVLEFGAMVTINRAQQAILHVSDITHDQTLLKKPARELIKPGQRFKVKITQVDKGTGNVKVSRKALFDSNEHSESDNLEPLKSATGGPFDPVLLTTFDSSGAKMATTVLEDPDALPQFSDSHGGSGLAITSTFPLSPPKLYNKDFFSNQVVSKNDINVAMERQRNNLPLKGSIISLSSASSRNAMNKRNRQTPTSEQRLAQDMQRKDFKNDKQRQARLEEFKRAKTDQELLQGNEKDQNKNKRKSKIRSKSTSSSSSTEQAQGQQEGGGERSFSKEKGSE